MTKVSNPAQPKQKTASAVVYFVEKPARKPKAEPYYSLKEIARFTGLSYSFVRQNWRDWVGQDCPIREYLKIGPRIAIPESAVLRIQKKYTVKTG